jgi:cell division protein FtsQ
MLVKTRPKRRLGWPFGRRRNRRVRLTGSALPSPTGWLRAAVRRSARMALSLGILAALGGAAFAAHHFVTRSSHFAVRAVRISPTRHASSESLTARAGDLTGQNLFKVDLDEVARAVREEPWLKSAHARRELPATIVVDVVERDPACGVALGPVYLADARGDVFKRASPDEAAGLPVVTGVDRDLYLADPDGAKLQIRDALTALESWRKKPSRPAVGEVHLDKLLGVTLFVSDPSAGSLAVRLGPPGADLDTRLSRFDAVWSSLRAGGETPRLIYLDNRARPDRVTVKLTAPPPPPAVKKPKATRTEPVPTEGDDDSEKRDT